jgi:hypothetical protein
MDFRRNPRVFRAWRIERFNTRSLGKAASTARDSRANRKRAIPEYSRKGRW